MAFLLRGGRVVTEGAVVDRDVLVRDGTIEEVAENVAPNRADETIDCDGAVVLPGAVDVHVHFREPGATHKEDWGSGSRSAAAGGVTTVVDQPNTKPATVSGEAWDQKRELAEQKSIVDYGLNAGVTPDWRPDELLSRPVTAYGEVFMADSTGEMGVTVEFFREAVERLQNERELVTVHAEDASLFQDVDGDDADAWSRHRPPEAEVAAVERAIEIAEDPLHFAHISHPDSVDLISGTPHTCEATPHHLLLSRDDLPELGTFGTMNPPLRSEEARRGLWRRLQRGDVDAVASDHAPHTREEKQADVLSAPAGVPGVETMLPLLLARVADGELDLDRVVELTMKAPARIYGFERKGGIQEGMDADLVVTDMQPSTIRADNLHSRAGWTPFAGREAVFPRVVYRRGEVVFGDVFPEAGGRLVGGV